jgi:lysophospholipase L1-like esterase
MRKGPGRVRAAVAVALISVPALVAGCSSGGEGHGTRARAAEASAAGSPLPRPTPTWDDRPASVAALGDSITRGFDACGLLADCPKVSWATRLAALFPAKSWNLAKSGARMADLAGQAERAASRSPAQVLVLMGANDACQDSLAKMTQVAEYRHQFTDAMDILHRRLPKAQVFVASVPDLKRLWEVGRTNPLGKQIWKFGICPSMLGDADAVTAAAERRRDAVRERVIAYNEVLKQVCGQYERCRYDGGAVFGYRFTARELSPWDWFHPSIEGQTQLARIVYQAAFGSRSVPSRSRR